jgi:hypothetical protein
MKMSFSEHKKDISKTRWKIFRAYLVLIYLYLLVGVPVLLFLVFLISPSARDRLFPVILVGLMAGYLLGDLIKRKKRHIRILRYSNLIRRFECGERFAEGSADQQGFKEVLGVIVKKEHSED